jgi:hypothetical protein
MPGSRGSHSYPDQPGTTGRALGEGIVAGINSKRGAVSAAASSLIARATGGVKSPSSVWAYD